MVNRIMAQQNTNDPENRILKVGSKVYIDKPTHKGWFWKYGWVAEIRDNEALINYGIQQYPIYGMGIWVKIEDLEVLR